jgi:HSP20 family molecular chaperone IbpA
MMDNFVDSFFNEFKTPGAFITTLGKQSFPKLNIRYSKEDEMTIEASVPGINKDDISVDITEEKVDGKDRAILTISGKSSNDKSTGKDDVVVIREIHKTSFSRSLVLPEEIENEDLDKVKATLKDGLLIIKIKCKKALIDKPKTRKLQIEDMTDK